MKGKLISKVVFLFVISNILIFSSFSNNIKGIPNDINLVFINDILYENSSIDLQNSFNLRYQEVYTELYNASYSFTNITDNTTSTDISFVSVDNSGVGSGVLIIPILNGHSKVLRLFDTSVSTEYNIDNTFVAQSFGTIELFINSNDTTKLSQIRITNGGTSLFTIQINGGIFQYFDSGGAHSLGSATNNNWYHIRLDFECTAGSYLSLSQYFYRLSINDIVQGTYSFQNNQPETETLTLETNNPSVDFYTNYDAIGYSWLDNYTIGKNMFPFINKSNTLQEIDRYEFAMSAIDTFHPTGADSTNGWTDIEVGGGDKVGIAIQGNVNGLIYSTSNVLSDKRGTEKLNLGINGEFINVSIGIKPEVIEGAFNKITIIIYDSDNVSITNLFIESDLSVRVSDDSGTFNLNRDVTLLRNYEFNFFLNYELDICFLMYIQDGILQEIYSYTLMNNNKQGLNKIEVYAFNTNANTVSYFIDYIGIYNSGVSILDEAVEFGLSTRLLEGVSNWNYEHNNLVNIIANGNFHLGAVDGGNYFRGSTLLTIRNESNYIQNETVFLNIYDAFVSEVSIPRLVFTLVSGLFNFSYFKIDGVLLNETETSNSYHLKFTHSNVDIRESYFYVSNNQLRFIHNSNDTTLEFIQARFSVEPISSSDITVSFKSFIQDNAFGFFRLNFTDTSNLIQMDDTERTIRFIPTQDLTINDLIILITDIDDNSVSGFTTGYVSNIKFLITSNISASIITDSLINMMIPIIMIIIPTLALSNRYGKNVIIPMFLLMSIICVVSSLIPVWLFFVIAISCSLFIIKRDDIR